MANWAGVDHRVEVVPGRTLAVNECGDPQGCPVLFFHGWPASRLQGATFAAGAQELGFRILAPDRPGIGLSTFQPGRKLADWPPLVTALADHFQLEKFSVVALSGGGPYAFAAAHALAGRVREMAVISGAPPLDMAEDRRVLLPLYRILLGTHRRVPHLARSLFHLARPVLATPPPRWSYPLLRWCAPAHDQPGLREPEVMAVNLACARESWRGSAQGVAMDGEIYAQPWGFPPEEVTVPTQVWHGQEDTSFPWQLAQKLAARLPHGKFHLVPAEGHYSLPIRHAKAILQSLLRS